jgi:hypothetical protein
MSDTAAKTDLTRMALTWRLESQLEVIKFMLEGPYHKRGALRCRRLTRQFEHVQKWSAARATAVFERLGKRRPDYIQSLLTEAREFCDELAAAIAGACP